MNETHYNILSDIKSAVLSVEELTLVDKIQFTATILSGVMDLILFFIAVYTFYLTFISSKITILTFGYSFNMWKSDSFNVLIKNNSLKNHIISKVYAVFDNKYRIKIREFDLPMVLEPFRSMKIEMEPYTRIDNLNLFGATSKEKINFYLEIITDEQKTIYAKIKNNRKQKINKKALLEDVFIFKKTVNGVVIKDDYVYVLHYKFDASNQIETAFINDRGLISTEIFGFSSIPLEYLNDIEIVKNCFDESCQKHGIALAIHKIEDLKIH